MSNKLFKDKNEVFVIGHHYKLAISKKFILDYASKIFWMLVEGAKIEIFGSKFTL